MSIDSPNRAISPAATNPMAIAALVATFVLPPVGVILALIARKQIRDRQQGGAGLAQVGLVLSSIFTVLTVLAATGAMILVGSLNLHGAAEETQAGVRAAAVSDARAMAAFQETWKATHPDEPGFPVGPDNTSPDGRIMIGDQQYQATEGNAVTVTVAPATNETPAGYCVTVAPTVTYQGPDAGAAPHEPVRYDSVTGDLVTADRPGPICTATTTADTN